MITRLKRRWDIWRRARRFAASVQHLHGPTQPTTQKDAVIVVALVRDGMFYLDEFLRHYRGLGAAQFIFCDNGSSDGTIDRLRAEDDCVVLQSLLPWGEVENDLRRHAAERYAPGRWCLFADMDEVFVCDEGLPALVRRLDGLGATALVAQMLEMIPKEPLSLASGLSYAEALETYDWYDLRQVECRDYDDPEIGFSWFLQQNKAPDTVKVMFGGLRKRVFNEACCLTKHPLVKVSPGVQPGVHPHVSAYVTCANFTALIKHYKFAGPVGARDADTVARGVVPHGEDRARLAKLSSDPDLLLWSDAACRYAGLEPLYKAGFLLRGDTGEAE